MIAREQFLAAVASAIGTPVGHHGRTIGGALDCVGLPWAAARACGLDLPPTQRYGKLPSGDELAAGLALFCDRVADPAAAHLLQVYAGRQPRHVVVIERIESPDRIVIVHAWGKNRIVQRTTLADQVAQAWRIRGVD